MKMHRWTIIIMAIFWHIIKLKNINSANNYWEMGHSSLFVATMCYFFLGFCGKQILRP